MIKMHQHIWDWLEKRKSHIDDKKVDFFANEIFEFLKKWNRITFNQIKFALKSHLYDKWYELKDIASLHWEKIQHKRAVLRIQRTHYKTEIDGEIINAISISKCDFFNHSIFQHIKFENIDTHRPDFDKKRTFEFS